MRYYEPPVLVTYGLRISITCLDRTCDELTYYEPNDALNSYTQCIARNSGSIRVLTIDVISKPIGTNLDAIGSQDYFEKMSKSYTPHLISANLGIFWYRSSD